MLDLDQDEFNRRFTEATCFKKRFPWVSYEYRKIAELENEKKNMMEILLCVEDTVMK